VLILSAYVDGFYSVAGTETGTETGMGIKGCSIT
jgi:hypothetical protein